MSKKKQIIEEMWQDIYNALPDYEHNWRDCVSAAEEMYDKGWRKQSEGEWEFVEEEDFIYCLCKCSACGKEVFFDVDDKRYNFCPNCGAKMKGGAE